MEWKYYNNAISPMCPPKEKVVLTESISDLFKKWPTALMVKYTTNIDELGETQWWHCIKDDRFDIMSLKSKNRNVVNNGIRNFDIRKINLNEYIDEMYELLIDANKGYSYKINISKVQVYEKCRLISNMKGSTVFGAFLKSDDLDNGKLCGYLWTNKNGNCIELVEQKAIRRFERLQVNAALVAALCEQYNDKFEKGYYLYDGERNIVHKTAFQEYLIKYFGFRKAYCKLNVVYSKRIFLFVKILYNIRFIIRPIVSKSNNHLFQKINGILLLEDILRWQKNERI